MTNKELQEEDNRITVLEKALNQLKNNKQEEPKNQYKFNVGDRVQFKSIEEIEKDYILSFIADNNMLRLAGTYATIKKINKGCPELIQLCDFSIDKYENEAWGIWMYSSDMLKPATSEPKFKVGDRVRVQYWEDSKCVIAKINGNEATISTDKIEDDGSICEFKLDLEDLEPYTEPRWTFTSDEKAILRNLKEKYTWIARDEEGDLFVYTSKPEKYYDGWGVGLKNNVLSLEAFEKNLFKSIRWRDDNPCDFRKYI